MCVLADRELVAEDLVSLYAQEPQTTQRLQPTTTTTTSPVTTTTTTTTTTTVDAEDEALSPSKKRRRRCLSECNNNYNYDNSNYDNELLKDDTAETEHSKLNQDITTAGATVDIDSDEMMTVTNDAISSGGISAASQSRTNNVISTSSPSSLAVEGSSSHPLKGLCTGDCVMFML